MDQQTIVVEYKDSLPMGDWYTPVPNKILWHKKISTGAKFAYTAILNYATRGINFPGQKQLAEEIGIHPWTMSKYLQELKNHELLEMKRQGLGKTDIYILKNLS